MSLRKKENFGIGVLFLGSAVRRYTSTYEKDSIVEKLKGVDYLDVTEEGRFSSALTFFNYMFPFGHFAKLRGRLLKNGSIELIISPITIRAIQLIIISLYSITLSAVRLSDNRSWKVLGILGLHFAVLVTVWWLIRLVYVADARHKFNRIKKLIRLTEDKE